MIKKSIMYFILILVILYFAFTIIAPPIVNKSKNKTLLSKPYQISASAQKLLASMDFVADLHCDALLWNRDLTKKSDYGHVDFPRMNEGNIALQAFTLVTKSPKGQNFQENSADAFDNITPLSIGQRQPISTWFSLVNRAIYQCEKLHKFAADYEHPFIIIKNKEDFQNLLNLRAKDRNVMGGFLGIEGGHCLAGKIDNFQKVYDAGVRMLGPAHFFDNEMGGSAHGVKRGGLTKFGFEVLQKMEEKSMIVDIAHSSVSVIDEILKNYEGPILSSHTGVQGFYNSPRNLADRHLYAIAARDGLVGIGFFSGAVKEAKLENIVKTIRYTADLIGIQHVALGSDFDGSVTTPFDCSGFGLIVDEMMKQGFSEGEIRAVLGENVKRFMLKHLK